MKPDSTATDTGGQRLDKWLWAARLFKTRNLASEAVSGGKVHVDGQRVKPARSIRPGNEVRVRKRNFEITLIIEALSRQRGPATEAQKLYTETPASQAQREQAAELRRQSDQHRGQRNERPSKRDRRQLSRLRQATPE